MRKLTCSSPLRVLSDRAVDTFVTVVYVDRDSPLGGMADDSISAYATPKEIRPRGSEAQVPRCRFCAPHHGRRHGTAQRNAAQRSGGREGLRGTPDGSLTAVMRMDPTKMKPNWQNSSPNLTDPTAHMSQMLWLCGRCSGAQVLRCNGWPMMTGPCTV